MHDYKKNDPRGWMGDPSRGAAMGRPHVSTLKYEYTGYIYVREVVLDGDGYDCLGTYFGAGAPLWWCVVDGDNTHLDMIFRGSAEAVAAHLKKKFPDSQVCFAPEKIE